MRVLGIDLGVARMGVALLSQSSDLEITCIFHECIQTKKEQGITERLFLIYTALNQIVSVWKPDHISIENVFHGKNSKTVNMINQVHGVVYLVIQKCQLPYSEYSPNQIKKHLCGNSKAKKEEIMQTVEKLFKLGKMKDDTADAIAVAYTYFQLVLIAKKLTL